MTRKEALAELQRWSDARATICKGDLMSPHEPKAMQLRRNRKDGGLFWGCSLFPKCRQTQAYTPDPRWIPTKEEPTERRPEAFRMNQADDMAISVRSSDEEIPYVMSRDEALAEFQAAKATWGRCRPCSGRSRSSGRTHPARQA